MILKLLILAALLASLAIALFLVLLVWISAGSPDANGDPERDAGWSDREIAERARSWDRGSHATETRPNLEYARRQNREALRRACGS